MRKWLGNARIAAAVLPVAVTVILATATDRVFAETWRIGNADSSAAVHMRQTASNRSKVLAYIPATERGIKGGACKRMWCPIEFRGMKGWVFRKYLRRDEEAAKVTPPVPVAAAEAASTSAKTDVAGEAPKVLKLGTGEGPPIPVYAFPNEKLPVAGHLAPDTVLVERVGPCMQNWCYIRSGTLIGWLQESVLAKQAPTTADATASVSARAGMGKRTETRSVNGTETTATQTATLQDEPSPRTVTDDGNKLYAIAGLSGEVLPIRESAEDNAPIIAVIPSDAKDIEGLHKCSGTWCLIRYQGSTGWVKRRHLADESLEGTKTFRVSNVALWSALDVFDSPSADAAVVGRIPAYATGVVPIGGCDRTWCHIRYLGVAGWVNGQYLAPAGAR